jgi:hypothetical protein
MSSFQSGIESNTSSNKIFNIYCGQNVMVKQENIGGMSTLDNNGKLLYCKGVIKEIKNVMPSSQDITEPIKLYVIDYFPQTILREKEKINDNFYVEDNKNIEELSNYLEKKEQLYAINSLIKINENIQLNKKPNYVDALIIGENSNNETYTIKIQKNNKILENIDIKDIYTSCDPTPETYTNTNLKEEVEKENILENESIIKTEPICERNKQFSTELFIKRRKDLFGFILISLSILSFFIILSKYIPNFELLEKMKENILFVKNFIILPLFSLGVIFFILIIVSKENLNILNLGVFISIIIIIWGLSWFFKNQENTYFYKIFNKENPSEIEKILKIIWLFIFPLSLGPFFIIIYLFFFIPNLIFNFLKIPNYSLQMDKYFYGQIPGILGSNITLYILILIIFLFTYFYLISYFFDGYIEISQKNKDNFLTDNPIIKLNEISTYTKNIINKYWFESILISLLILYIIFKVFIPSITFISEKIPSLIKLMNICPDVSNKFLFVVLIIYIFLISSKYIILKIINNNIKKIKE